MPVAPSPASTAGPSPTPETPSSAPAPPATTAPGPPPIQPAAHPTNSPSRASPPQAHPPPSPRSPSQGQAIVPDGRVFTSGTIAKTGGITDDDNTGIWLKDGATRSLVLQEDDAATDVGAGVQYGEIDDLIAANASGHVAFSSDLRGTGITSGVNNIALFAGTPVGTTLIAQRGGIVPGLTGTPEIDRFLEHAMNASSQVLFAATLKNGAVTTADNSALLTDAGGSLQPVVREGDAAVGFGDPTAVYDEFNDFFICDDGTCYFRATVRGGTPALNATQNDAIYAWTSAGGVQLVAMEDDVTPAAGTAGFFKNLATSTLSADAAGNLAFTGILKGGVGGVTNANDHGVWTLKNGGALQILLRDGIDMLEIGGTATTIKRVFIAEHQHGGVAGRSTSLAAGNIAVVATFPAGKAGVFILALP